MQQIIDSEVSRPDLSRFNWFHISTPVERLFVIVQAAYEARYNGYVPADVVMKLTGLTDRELARATERTGSVSEVNGYYAPGLPRGLDIDDRLRYEAKQIVAEFSPW